MSVLKTKPTDEDVTKLIESLNDDQQREDSHELLKTLSKITGEEPVIWGRNMIGFGQFEYSTAKGIAKWFLIGFTPRKNDLSIHVMTGLDVHKKQLKKLGKHGRGNSCLHVKKLDGIDRDVLKDILNDSWNQLKSRNNKLWER